MILLIKPILKNWIHSCHFPHPSHSWCSSSYEPSLHSPLLRWSRLPDRIGKIGSLRSRGTVFRRWMRPRLGLFRIFWRSTMPFLRIGWYYWWWSRIVGQPSQTSRSCERGSRRGDRWICVRRGKSVWLPLIYRSGRRRFKEWTIWSIVKGKWVILRNSQFYFWLPAHKFPLSAIRVLSLSWCLFQCLLWFIFIGTAQQYRTIHCSRGPLWSGWWRCQWYFSRFPYRDYPQTI